MGAWGVGLYSSDFACDMRPLIKSALRLPFDEDRIAALIREREAGSADNPDDEDHAVFWLTLADQFEKRGVAHAPTRATAIALIDSGADLAMLEKLGMKASDLRKRAAILADLRARLVAASTVSKPRPTLKAPLPYVFDVGVAYACPVRGSEAINPYIGKKNFDGTPWVADGYRQFVNLARDKAFGYLPWYQPLVAIRPTPEKPERCDPRMDLWWKLDSPKSCSERHYKIMEIASVGPVPVDLDKARRRFPERPRGVYFGWDGTGAAVNDISIGNCMVHTVHDWKTWYVARGELPQEGPTVMRSLEEILCDDA
jgi:hypothetical protein